jgi:predicted nuclease of predicted toxin-antitoxin system
MKFKTDENLPVEVVTVLCDHGHDAISVIDQNLAGSVDGVVANVCKTEQRVLMTLDLDFADIRTYPPEEYSGIIVMRPKVQTISAIVSLTEQVVRLLESSSPAGQLWILDEFHVRIRPR